MVAVGNAFLEGAAMALIVPLLQLLGFEGNADAGAITHYFNKALDWLGIPHTLEWAAGVILLVFAVQYSVFLMQSWMAAKIQTAYVARWRQSLFDDLIHANWPFFVSRKTGKLTNAVISETNRLENAVFSLLMIITTSIVTFVYVLLAFFMSWQVTAILLVMGTLFVLVTWPLVRQGKHLGQAIIQHNEDFLSWVGEVFGGAKVIKATLAEDLAVDRFTVTKSALRDLEFRVRFQPNLIRSIFEFLAVVGLMAGLVISTQVFNVELATMIVVVALFVRLYPRLSNLQQQLQRINVFLPALPYLEQLQREARAATEKFDRPTSLPDFEGPIAVRIENLTVKYGDKTAIDNVSLDVPAGRIVAVVGESGSGKTTLLDSLLGLVTPANGSIRADDHVITGPEVRAFRKRVGYVTQETILFNMSVRDNIAWTIGTFSDAEIVEAARQANAHGFIQEMAQGYDTMVGDRGVRMSGGQRQRIGLARALVGRKNLLVLDEATNALDTYNEQEVMKAIENLRGQVTVIIVAHRISTVKLADTIVVMDNGHIVEQGSWEHLLSAKGRFKAMSDHQMHSN